MSSFTALAATVLLISFVNGIRGFDVPFRVLAATALAILPVVLKLPGQGLVAPSV